MLSVLFNLMILAPENEKWFLELYPNKLNKFIIKINLPVTEVPELLCHLFHKERINRASLMPTHDNIVKCLEFHKRVMKKVKEIKKL